MKSAKMLLVLALCASGATAQFTWNDGFEAYNLGSLCSFATCANAGSAGGWGGWNNLPAGAATVVDSTTAVPPIPAHGGTKFVQIGSATDAIQPFSLNYPGTYPTSGTWEISAWTYVPTGGLTAVSYFIVNNFYKHNGPYNWALQLQFTTAGAVTDTNRGGSVPVVFDAWTQIQITVDLTANLAVIKYNGQPVSAGVWTVGSGPRTIANFDLYTGGTVFYDDLVVQPAVFPAPISGTYTIDSSLPTGGGNFATFAEAVTFLKANLVGGPVAFDVYNGTGPYLGFGISSALPGVSAINTVTFRAAPGHTPVVSGPAGTNVQTIKLGTALTAGSGPSHIVLNGLRVTGAPSGAGIIAAGCTNIVVRNCIVYTCGGGICYAYTTASRIEDCEVYGVANTVGSPGSSTYAGALNLYNLANDCVIRRNRVHDCTGNGIFIGAAGTTTACSNAVVVSNFIWATPGLGSYPGGIAIRRAPGSVIANNSVYMPAGTALGGIFQSGDVPPAVISNNIVKHDGTGACFKFESTTSSVPATIDYNHYDPAATAKVGAVSTTTYATIALWRAVASPSMAGKELNSIQALAGFVAATDLHITVASAAYNSGSPVADAAADVDIQPRPMAGTADRGADEVVGAGLAADFTAAPLSTFAPLPVAFTDASLSTDPGGITSWAWDFQNDGIDDAFVQNPTFAYASPGTYAVKLTVTDGSNPPSVRVRTGYITVGAALRADFTANPLTGPVGFGPLAFTANFFDQSLTTAPGGITSWAWDFNGDSIIDSTQQYPSFAYPTPGLYSVTLTVTDGVNPPASFTRTNYVTAQPYQFRLFTTGSGVGDVYISPLPSTQATGYMLLSFNTTLPVGAGPFFGISPDYTSWTLVLSPATVGGIFHWITTPALFPNGGFGLPPGSLSALAGISVDGVQIDLTASMAIANVSTVSRITF